METVAAVVRAAMVVTDTHRGTVCFCSIKQQQQQQSTEGSETQSDSRSNRLPDSNTASSSE